MARWMSALVVVVMAAGPIPVAQAKDATEKLEGYAEWLKDDLLIVDGQRVRPARRMTFKGKGDAHDFESIPLGYEVKVKGVRDAQGVVVASEVEAKPNGTALFENDLRESFDETEQQWLRRGRVFEEDEDGKVEVIGRLRTRGAQVDRVRRITEDLIPPYLDADDFRIYVVDNKDWNAFAAPNRSIYVFTGLLKDLDDDELAIVLGHELAHATHEHGRKGFKKQLPILLAQLAVVAAAETMDNEAARTAVQIGAVLAGMAIHNGYGRQHEDQADRTGTRYAYEAGYDVSKAPGLWRRFASRYGNGDKVTNFFFSDHTQSRVRASNLEEQMALNYGGDDEPSNEDGTRTAWRGED